MIREAQMPQGEQAQDPADQLVWEETQEKVISIKEETDAQNSNKELTELQLDTQRRQCWVPDGRMLAGTDQMLEHENPQDDEVARADGQCFQGESSCDLRGNRGIIARKEIKSERHIGGAQDNWDMFGPQTGSARSKRRSMQGGY